MATSLLRCEFAYLVLQKDVETEEGTGHKHPINLLEIYSRVPKFLDVPPVVNMVPFTITFFNL